MHIYTNEEYDKKQKQFIQKNAFDASFLTGVYLKPAVIKNYIYYDEPVKIN